MVNEGLTYIVVKAGKKIEYKTIDEALRATMNTDGAGSASQVLEVDREGRRLLLWTEGRTEGWKPE